MNGIANSLAWTSIALVVAGAILIAGAGLGFWDSTGVPWIPFGQLVDWLTLLALISVLLSVAAWLLTRNVERKQRPMIVRAAGSVAWVVGICFTLLISFFIFVFSHCPKGYC